MVKTICRGGDRNAMKLYIVVHGTLGYYWPFGKQTLSMSVCNDSKLKCLAI